MAERSRTIGKLTPRMLAQAQVIAKGNRIRDVQRLVATYGGKHSTWVKKSSPPFAVGLIIMSIIGMNILALGAWN